jgi:hypothetical protein
MKRRARAQEIERGVSANAKEVERIVGEQIDALPRLKAARDAMRRVRKTEDKFVEDALKSFRQRLKE